MYRIAIAGAASLAGKELGEELSDSVLGASDVVLLDQEDAAGQITASSDEAAFIQQLDESSFDRMDFVFFADREVARKLWRQARKAGASLVDLTYALEEEKGVLVRAPWVAEVLAGAIDETGLQPNLTTPAVVSAHPAAIILALIAGRLQSRRKLKSIAATVMEPASEHGRAAMDELHQQTVNLLSFQSLPREQYDAQVSFNLLPVLGEAGKIKLQESEQQIRRHYALIGGGILPELALQMIQAPVFHGYVISMLVELDDFATAADLKTALTGEHITLTDEGAEPPSNLNATGQHEIMVRISEELQKGSQGSRFWMWIAADNLKLSALNAIACARELRRLRPHGKVQ